VDAFGALRAGSFDDAGAAAEATLGYFEGVDGFGVAVWCHAFLAQIALHRGEPELARQHVDTAEAWLARGERAQLGYEQLRIAAARLCELRGELDAAFVALAEVWDLFALLGVRSPLPSFGATFARLARHGGDSARAAEVATALEEAATDSGTGSVRVAAELAAAWRDVDPDRALRAADLARAGPRRPLVAAALTDAANLLHARRRRGEADRVAAEGARRWSELGADADALACVAVSRTARRPAPRPRFGPAALTATERNVVGLLADGLANADIAAQLGVSRRTVESHVSAAYRKLEVASRVELARAALAYGLGTG
jgi:DNA-binding NarL/FixJ family response regulator